MDATTYTVRMPRRLHQEFLDLAKPGALLDAARAAEVAKNGVWLTATADAARELGGYLRTWPRIWNAFVGTGDHSRHTSTTLKRGLKAVAVQFRAAFPAPRPAPQVAVVAPPDVQEGPLAAPEPEGTPSPTPAAPDAISEVLEVPAAVPAATPTEPQAAPAVPPLAVSPLPEAPAPVLAVKPLPLPTETLHALARRWLAGERISPLAKEVGLSWQMLHSALAGRLGYRPPQKEAR